MASCDLNEEIKEKLRKFSFSQAINSAMILKINRKENTVVVDRTIENASMEEFAKYMPDSVPRFILFSYKYVHDETDQYSRFSVPLLLIYFSPPTVQTYLNMVYTATKLTIMDQLKVAKVYDISSEEDMTTEWLRGKLKGYR
ncbi:hypothetical protein M0813_22979 [Anaeramoeba flamelloides]|uniref:ADF-H domain-containing protein n=1 Tax=Anaeramoeba flamelloides TaxID=1746091 RepID=A0AAV7YSH0_9EUKA|nr:hypothetical protein M0812_21671 [Anaeramoeba flamelloides]KAJ6242206.1 hypothetical protein M0813_22979 [Anaeramoeba flamelloides]